MQLVKRNVPLCLLKVIMQQLFSNKICVFNSLYFYARCGVKQGGVLSGILFSACYDDLVDLLHTVGAGILIRSLNDNSTFICVLIYADDVILFSQSPYGLQRLIKCAYLFAKEYHDITFNPTKSRILRLGRHHKPPVSVCGIPVSSCQEYLGITIGKDADHEKDAASKLYANTNLMLSQNSELKKCSHDVKNVVVRCYGNLYSIENMLSVGSKVRNAHRYLTKAVHSDWVQYADLDGPNIRSRTLYVFNGLDSLEVLHRRRRNNFLIKASLHENALISNVIGNLPRITV